MAEQNPAHATKMNLNWRGMALVGGVSILLWSAGIASTIWLPVGIAFLALCTAVPALLTFLVFYRDSFDIRTTLTAAFFVLYLSIIIASFNPDVRELYREPGSFLGSIWSNFSYIMLAIAGFYFGSKLIEILWRDRG